MMRSEFLELTGFTENYITSERYSYIEKAYMNTEEPKQKFCKRFYKEYLEVVAKPTEMLIKAKSLEEKEEYCNGNKSVFSDIEKVNEALMTAFCKTFK